MAARAPRLDTLVLGAGVIGLTTAVRLLERGHRVLVRAEARTPHTTSDHASALFYAYAHGRDARTDAWLRVSEESFRRLAMEPGPGVSRTRIEDAAPDPARGPRYGDEPTTFLIDMPRYLAWLEARVLALGGRFDARRVTSLLELLGEADVVVNCTGLGARDLVADPELASSRGRTLVVENFGRDVPLLDLADESRPPLYVVPRGDVLIVGGTNEPHAEDTEPDEAAERAMLARAAAADPRLARARILERRAALRPARTSVRVERELVAGLRVVHHYGHGGAGVTLSWGSAEEAVALVERHAPAPPPDARVAEPARLYTNGAHRRAAR